MIKNETVWLNLSSFLIYNIPLSNYLIKWMITVYYESDMRLQFTKKQNI